MVTTPREPVEADVIESEFERLRRLALEAEARGESIVMRDPKIKPKPPRKPS